MHLRKIILMGAAFSVLVTWGGLTFAQNQQPPQGQGGFGRRGRGGFGGFQRGGANGQNGAAGRFGQGGVGQNGFGQGRFGQNPFGFNANIIDPSRNYVMELLQRDDVKAA